MFCSNCGEQLSDGSKFCQRCGAQQLNSTKTPQQETVQENPFETPQQEEVQGNPFEAAQGQVQSSFEKSQNGGQWGPMMKPEKKNKTPLIIGIVAAIVAVIAVIVVIVFVISGGSDDKEKKNNKETIVKEIETTKADGGFSSDEYSDEEIEKVAVDLLDKYMQAIVAGSLDDVKKLFIEGVYNEMVSFYVEYDYSDEEIIKELQMVDESFGAIKKFTINDDIECAYNSEPTEAFMENFGVDEKDNLLRYYELTGSITVESADRKGTFEYDMYVFQSNEAFTIGEMYGYNSSFSNYPYEFKGTGSDEFGNYYIDEDEETTESTEKDTDAVDEEDDELVQMIIEHMNLSGTGEASENDIVQNGTKAILSRSYEQLKKVIIPYMPALYDIFVEEGYYTEDEIETEIFDDLGVLSKVTMVSVSVNGTENYNKSEIEEINNELEEYNLDSIIVFEELKTLDTTIIYKNSSNENKTVDCVITIVKLSGKWYIGEFELDEDIQ